MRPIVPNPGRSRVVDKSGGAHASGIQEAIDSIPETDYYNRYTVIVYPGIYEENIIMKDYVTIVGMSSGNDDVKITASSGTILTASAFSALQNLTIEAIDTAIAVDVSGLYGLTRLLANNCSFTFRSEDSNPQCLFYLDGGFLDLIDCFLTYRHEDSDLTLPAQTNRMFLLEPNSTPNTLYITGGHIEIQVTDQNPFILLDVNGASSLVYIIRNCSMKLASDYNLTVLKDNQLNPLPINLAPRTFMGNIIQLRVENSLRFTSTGEIYNIDSTDPDMEVNSFSNRLVVAEHDLKYMAQVTNGILVSHYDDVEAEHLYSGIENIRILNSHQDGELNVDNILLEEKFRSIRDMTSFTPTDIDTVFQIILNTIGSTGGRTHVFDISQAGTAGDACVAFVSTGKDIHPIHQHIGLPDPVALNKAWRVASSVWTDATTAFQTSDPGGSNNFIIFNANNDQIYIGSDTKFDEIHINLETFASLPGILPIFEYWDGDSWETFTPVDGTNQLQVSGVISFQQENLIDWTTTQVNGESDGPWYYVRITRTRPILTISPREDTIDATVTYDGNWFWDKDGKIVIDKLLSATELRIPEVDDTGMDETPGTRGDIVLNSDNVVYICTVTHATAATWDALN